MSAIALKKPKLLIPDAWLERALKENRNGLGFALHDGKEPVIAMERGAGAWDLDTIRGIQESYKECGIIFNFMSLGAKAVADDLQPFILVGKDEQNAKLVGFAEGDFFNFIASGSDHPNEYFVFNRYLTPKLMKIYESCKGDLDKFMKELNDPVFKQDMINTCGPNGTIVLLASNGQTVLFENNALKRTYNWGIVSKHYGYAEDEVKPTKVMEFLKKKKEAAAEPKKDVPIIASTEPIKPAEPPKTDTAVPADAGTEYTVFTPPEGISRRKLKRAYRRALGSLPANWEERPSIRYKKEPSVFKSFTELAKHIGTPSKPEPAVTDRTIPVLSPQVVKAILEEMGEDGTKELDNNSRRIMKLEEIVKYTDEYPDFEEATGILSDVTDLYSDEQLGFIAFKWPMAMLILAKGWRTRALEAENLISKKVEAEIITDEESKVDTSGTGVVAKDKPIPKWKQAMLDKQKKVAM